MTDRACDAALEVWLAQNPPKSASVITAFRGGFEAGRDFERRRRGARTCPRCGGPSEPYGPVGPDGRAGWRWCSACTLAFHEEGAGERPGP